MGGEARAKAEAGVGLRTEAYRGGAHLLKGQSWGAGPTSRHVAAAAEQQSTEVFAAARKHRSLHEEPLVFDHDSHVAKLAAPVLRDHRGGQRVAAEQDGSGRRGCSGRRRGCSRLGARTLGGTLGHADQTPFPPAPRGWADATTEAPQPSAPLAPSRRAGVEERNVRALSSEKEISK